MVRAVKWEGLMGVVREALGEYEREHENWDGDGLSGREQLTEVIGKMRLENDGGQMDGAEELRKVLEKMKLGSGEWAAGW